MQKDTAQSQGGLWKRILEEFQIGETPLLKSEALIHFHGCLIFISSTSNAFLEENP